MRRGAWEGVSFVASCGPGSALGGTRGWGGVLCNTLLSVRPIFSFRWKVPKGEGCEPAEFGDYGINCSRGAIVSKT